MSLLDPRLWLACLLLALATFGAGYWRGGQATQADWTAEKLKQTQAAKDAERENRNIETARARHVNAAQSAATARTQQLQAAAGTARAESDRLRDTLASLERELPSLARPAADQHTAALAGVFDDCQRRYQELAAKADGHASDTLMLQQAWPTH